MPSEYTKADVAKHNNSDDLWIIIDGKVYDVTKFHDDHPGGGEVILEGAGKDNTGDFEDVGHSSDAREMLKDYEIGVVKDAKIATPPGQISEPSDQNNSAFQREADKLSTNDNPKDEKSKKGCKVC